ncbi:MAG: CDP-alcohol phosphatidyltransferase family protein [Tumebacillaceae bacterium]
MIRYLMDRANMITALGMLFGMASVLFSFSARWEAAVLCMLLAVVCDVFDGMVARKTRKTHDPMLSQMGVQFDSLADLVHSGVAPAFFVYNYTGQGVLSGVLLVMIVVTVFLRLAYYNCNGLSETGYFYGLPVFYSPMILAVVYGVVAWTEAGWLVAVYAVLVSLLHVLSALRIRKLTSGVGFYVFLSCLLGEIAVYLVLSSI